MNLTRFEVSLREKRQFFLEGQELFGQRIRTFYSRRIADITGGAKVLGRQGPWNVAFIGAETEPNGAKDRGNYSVGRLQRDVWGRSNIAVMATNRNLGGLNNGSVSVDANLFFSKTLGMTAQFVKSHGAYRHGTEGFYLRPSYDTPTGHFHVRYSHLGERLGDNVNATGQVSDDDRREIDSAAEKTWWIGSGPVQQVQYRLELQRLLEPAQRAAELEGGRGLRRPVPQPVEPAGPAQRGVQALREGLPQPRRPSSRSATTRASTSR